MKKNKTKIPKGFYCYSHSVQTDDPLCRKLVGVCPFLSTKKDCGIDITYCKFLGAGDVGNINDIDLDKLLEKYGTHEKLSKKYPLSLLWDMCKECGENEYTEKELEELI